MFTVNAVKPIRGEHIKMTISSGRSTTVNSDCSVDLETNITFTERICSEEIDYGIVSFQDFQCWLDAQYWLWILPNTVGRHTLWVRFSSQCGARYGRIFFLAPFTAAPIPDTCLLFIFFSSSYLLRRDRSVSDKQNCSAFTIVQTAFFEQKEFIENTFDLR